jgi:crotonobetaine/carnitine-CoA ligase
MGSTRFQEEGSAVDVVGTRTLRDLLGERERRFADKTFLVFVDRDGAASEHTYRDFVARVRATAAGLTACGIGKDDKVVIHLGNCPEFLFAWFGLAWIGAVAVPSNTANTDSEMRHIFALSDAVGVVTSADYAAMLGIVADDIPAVRLRVFARGDVAPEGWVPFAGLLAHGSVPPRAAVDSEDVAELMFTSGTTARPKAVMLTHANLLRAGEREWCMLGLDSTDRCLTALPVFHANAQTMTVLSSLTAGATCVLLADYGAQRFWACVREHRATVLSLVAMQVRTLLAQQPADTDRAHVVRRVLYAINVLDAEKTEFERRFGVELINGYGSTEALTVVSAAPLHGEKRWPSIGLPTIDRQVRLVGADGRDVPVGEVGEIVVSGIPGRTLMKGYYKNPEATAEALRDGWLHTGDNGFCDEYGYLYFFDRHSDVIKVAGENVGASEVERVLLAHPDIVEAGVVSAADAIRDEVPDLLTFPWVGFHAARPGSGGHRAPRV